MNNVQRTDDHALAYPEPSASPLWHRDEEQRRNGELLLHAQRPAARPCSPRSTEPRAEAS